MHLREAARRGGLVALAFLAASCAGRGGASGDGRETIQDLRDRLEGLQGRDDPDANLERARIHGRLRRLGGVAEVSALALGDGFDLKVLSGPARSEQKAESAGRLAGHFLERAERPALCRSAFAGPIGEPLRRFSMGMVAAAFSEYTSSEAHARALEKQAAVAEELADLEILKPEARERWKRRARAYTLLASSLAGRTAAVAPGAETLKFCEYGVSRHLEEATRAMDYGTREKAARGEPDRILEWYLMALAHLVVARECLENPSPAEAEALKALDVALQHIANEVVRTP